MNMSVELVLVDRPDPLRITDVIIVAGVLLLWFATIVIFIRHSELLRIRHRDLPFRSAVKPPVTSTHVPMHSRPSEMHRPYSYSKAYLSSSGAITPPPLMNSSCHDSQQQQKHAEINETHSTKVSSSSRQTLKVHSLDGNISLANHDDEDQLSNPSKFSTTIRQSLLELHKKSLENLVVIISPTSFSANDISRRKEQNNSQKLLTKKRCIHESPV